MKISIAIGYVVVCIMGILSHYAFDYFDISYLKVIFPQNESIFEHLKLIFYPMILYMLVDLLVIRKNNEGAFKAYVTGILLALLFTIAAYYTYSGMIGKHIFGVDMAIYFLSIFIAFFYRYKKITLFTGLNSVIVFVIMLIIMVVFTFYPGNINFFLPLE